MDANINPPIHYLQRGDMVVQELTTDLTEHIKADSIMSVALVRTAKKSLKVGRVGGCDVIVAEIYKLGGILNLFLHHQP